MTKQALRVSVLTCLTGAVLAIAIGGGRSAIRSQLSEFSEPVTAIYLLEWALLGIALGLFISPMIEPKSFRSPQRPQIVAGALFGLALALMHYGTMVSIVLGVVVGGGVGFLAPYWTPHLR